MEILSAIVLAVSPFIVTKLTGWFKTVLKAEKTPDRVATIKLFVLIGSLALGVANSWLTDSPLDTSIVANSVEGIVYAIVTYWGAGGIYLLKKKDLERKNRV